MSFSQVRRSGKLAGFVFRIGFVFSIGLAFAGVCIVLPVAAFADDLSDCSQPNDLPRALAGCTKLLQARGTKNHYIAYRNRSSAYAALGDFERAEQDYQHAIALNPRYLDSPANVLHAAAPQ